MHNSNLANVSMVVVGVVLLLILGWQLCASYRASKRRKKA